MAVPASSLPNAIAVGPTSSGLSASPTESSAAMRNSRFLTTRYVTSCLRRARRISAISFTLRPRYSETIIVRALGEFLAQLGDGLSFGLRGHVALLSFGTRPACGGGRPIDDRAAPATSLVAFRTEG